MAKKGAKKDNGEKGTEKLTISPPNFRVAEFHIRGTAPYVQNKFSSKAGAAMHAKQEAGQRAKKGSAKEPKDFQACYEGAMHVTSDGWCGIPAASFRNACISACRLVGFAMTRAKLSVFVEADGFDAEDGSPLVRITKGRPHYVEHAVRNESGVCDLRARPMWDLGWEAKVRMRYDGDQFGLQDLANLMMRVGMQIGIGEGRPDSKKSNGQGWGLFELLDH